MFTQNRSFQVKKPYDKLVAAMEEATEYGHPLPVVSIDEHKDNATFAVVQRFANFNGMALLEAVGTLNQQSKNSTQVEMRVNSITYPSIILTALQTLSIVIVYVLLRPDFDATLLTFILILSVAFLAWDRVRYTRQFRAQLDAFFGDAWRG